MQKIMSSAIYHWYVRVKPITLKVMALFFAICSLIILYAEFSNFIGFKHSLIYDIIHASVTDKNGSYFFTDVSLVFVK